MKRRVLGKTAPFHLLSQKKTWRRKLETVPFWNGTIFFFPWTRETGEEGDFFSFLCHRHPTFKKTSTYQPLSTCWTDGGGAAAQWPPHPRLPPLFLPIKIGEGEEKRRPRTKEKRKTERERERDQGREKRREKDERKRKEKKRKKKTAKEEENTEEGGETAGPRASAASVAATPGKPSAFLFCLHFFPHHSRRAQCTSAGGEKLVMHSNQLMWGGPSPAYVVGPGSA